MGSACTERTPVPNISGGVRGDARGKALAQGICMVLVSEPWQCGGVQQAGGVCMCGAVTSVWSVLRVVHTECLPCLGSRPCSSSLEGQVLLSCTR